MFSVPSFTFYHCQRAPYLLEIILSECLRTPLCKNQLVPGFHRNLTYFSPVTKYFNFIASQLICESGDELIFASPVFFLFMLLQLYHFHSLCHSERLFKTCTIQL